MPIFGITPAIIGLIGGIGTFLTGGTLLAKVAFAGLSMAANYAMQKFFGPKTPPAQASKLDTQYGEKLPREIVQGKVGHAGHHIYRNAYGRGNTIVQDVYVLSHWNIAGVTRVRFNGEWRTLGGAVDPERGQRIQGIDAEIWIKVYTGRMDQVADPGLIAHANPAGRWTENHRGAGVAYAVVTNLLHREHLPNPWDAFFEVEGVTYDFRKDDTVGGVGVHRYDDPTTWEPTTNPFLMAYCAARGFWRGEEKIVGKGRSASALPLARWTLAANIADEIVAGRKRYQAACILSSGEGTTHDANLQPLLEAAAASWIEMVGEEYPIAGANQTPATSFTDDDIVIGEPFRFSEKRTRSELVNTVAGTFVDPASFYQAMPLATRVDETALAADGERLAVPLSFTVVTEPACVDRLADIALRASRYQANGEICLRHKYLALKPGQWVTWTSARFGWTKTFQVLSKRLGPLGPKGARNVYVSLQEVGEGIFDPTAYVTLPPDGVVQGAPDFMSELQNFNVVAVTVKDDDTGKQYPGLRASWDQIDDPTVIGVDISYRPKFQPAVVLPHPTVPDDVSVTDIVNGIISSTIFEVSHRLVTSPYRQTPWSNWIEVLTDDAPWNDVVYPPGLEEEVQEFIGEAAPWIRDRELIDEARRLVASVVDLQTGAYRDRRQIRFQINSTLDQSKAYADLAIDVATGPNSAISQALIDLGAQIAGKAESSAVLLLQAEVDGIGEDVSANSNAIVALESGYGDATANANLRFTTSAGPEGPASRIGLEARTGSAGTFRPAALFIDVPANAALPTRVAILADQFSITNGTNTAQPFVFQNGEAIMNLARIGTVISALLKSPDDEFVIDLNNKFFEIWT